MGESVVETRVCHDCGGEYVPWGEVWDDFYCRPCHTKHFARSPRAICLVCQEQKLYLAFARSHRGYGLRRDGHNIYLYCRSCEQAFLALPEAQQAFYIRARCNLVFPSGQVIYGLADPESHLIRNIGRTHLPTKRLAAHLRDRHEGLTDVGTARYYSKANWMHDLHVKGLRPTMEVLKEVEIAPMCIEWERRYILHGIQQGWPLTNVETIDEGLLACAKASTLDFLHCSFESLVQERFARENGIEAFVRAFYRQ